MKDEMAKRRWWRSCNYAFRLHNCILIVIALTLNRRRYRSSCGQGEKNVQASSRATTGATSIPPQAGLGVPREVDVILHRECQSGIARCLKWAIYHRILGQHFERQFNSLVPSNFRNRDACERGKSFDGSTPHGKTLGRCARNMDSACPT